MQPIRTTARWLRLALAMLFAVVTLIQVPAMAVAYATAPARPAAAAPHDAPHNSHSHRDHAPQASDSAQGESVCQAMGCCVVAIEPAVIRAPAATYCLLGLVDIPPARVMLPALPEPTDPPPRLQV
jgi:hypothetical protein